MKHTRRIASLLLALVMVFAMAISVSADTTGSITVTPIQLGEGSGTPSYTAYKILDASVADPTAETVQVVYKALKIGDSYSAPACFDIDANGYVTLKANVEGENGKTYTNTDGTLGADAVADIKSWVDTNKNSLTSYSITGTTYTASVEYGYYYVTTTTGTAVSVSSITPTATVKDKNEAPVLEKTVKEDSNSKYGEKNHADIGQVVEFKTTIEVKAGAKGYILYDNMSDGLTFNANSVVVNNGTNDITASDNTYTLTTSGVTAPAGTLDTNATPCDFSITFADSWIASQVGKTITVTYSATVNANAVVADNGNPNETILKYGDENAPLYTPEDTTTTYTFEFSVNKTDGSGKGLAGAGFTLYKGDNAINLVAADNNTDGYPVYKVCTGTGCTHTHVTEVVTVVTNNSAKFEIEGLDADTYVLKETTVPAGYNKAADVTVKIGDDGKVYTVTAGENDTTSESEATDKTITVVNQSGSELPSTGGMGTTLFYVVGGLMVLAAVVLLVTKKRMSSAE